MSVVSSTIYCPGTDHAEFFEKTLIRRECGADIAASNAGRFAPSCTDVSSCADISV
jgi:hypothetical protein